MFHDYTWSLQSIFDLVSRAANPKDFLLVTGRLMSLMYFDRFDRFDPGWLQWLHDSWDFKGEDVIRRTKILRSFGSKSTTVPQPWLFGRCAREQGLSTKKQVESSSPLYSNMLGFSFSHQGQFRLACNRHTSNPWARVVPSTQRLSAKENLMTGYQDESERSELESLHCRSLFFFSHYFSYYFSTRLELSWAGTIWDSCQIRFIRYEVFMADTS